MLAQHVGLCFTPRGHTAGGVKQRREDCSKSETVQLLPVYMHTTFVSLVLSACLCRASHLLKNVFPPASINKFIMKADPCMQYNQLFH